MAFVQFYTFLHGHIMICSLSVLHVLLVLPRTFRQEDEEDALLQQVRAQQTPLEGALRVARRLVFPPAVVQVVAEEGPPQRGLVGTRGR